MFFQIANLILSTSALIALIIYAYYTYLIAKDVNEPFVSFSFHQIIPWSSHLEFHIVNKSKVEVESFGKLWVKKNKHFLEFEKGFYGNGHAWILQPFTDNNGHLELKDLVNQEKIKLSNLIEEGNISSIEFFFQIKYRKTGSIKWKKSSPQKFAYDFKKGLFWLNV